MSATAEGSEPIEQRKVRTAVGHKNSRLAQALKAANLASASASTSTSASASSTSQPSSPVSTLSAASGSSGSATGKRSLSASIQTDSVTSGSNKPSASGLHSNGPAASVNNLNNMSNEEILESLRQQFSTLFADISGGAAFTTVAASGGTATAVGSLTDQSGNSIGNITLSTATMPTTMGPAPPPGSNSSGTTATITTAGGTTITTGPEFAKAMLRSLSSLSAAGTSGGAGGSGSGAGGSSGGGQLTSKPGSASASGVLSFTASGSPTGNQVMVFGTSPTSDQSKPSSTTSTTAATAATAATSTAASKQTPVAAATQSAKSTAANTAGSKTGSSASSASQSGQRSQASSMSMIATGSGGTRASLASARNTNKSSSSSSNSGKNSSEEAIAANVTSIAEGVLGKIFSELLKDTKLVDRLNEAAAAAAAAAANNSQSGHDKSGKSSTGSRSASTGAASGSNISAGKLTAQELASMMTELSASHRCNNPNHHHCMAFMNAAHGNHPSSIYTGDDEDDDDEDDDDDEYDEEDDEETDGEFDEEEYDEDEDEDDEDYDDEDDEDEDEESVDGRGVSVNPDSTEAMMRSVRVGHLTDVYERYLKHINSSSSDGKVISNNNSNNNQSASAALPTSTTTNTAPVTTNGSTRKHSARHGRRSSLADGFDDEEYDRDPDDNGNNNNNENDYGSQPDDYDDEEEDDDGNYDDEDDEDGDGDDDYSGEDNDDSGEDGNNNSNNNKKHIEDGEGDDLDEEELASYPSLYETLKLEMDADNVYTVSEDPVSLASTNSNSGWKELLTLKLDKRMTDAEVIVSLSKDPRFARSLAQMLKVSLKQVVQQIFQSAQLSALSPKVVDVYHRLVHLQMLNAQKAIHSSRQNSTNPSITMTSPAMSAIDLTKIPEAVKRPDGLMECQVCYNTLLQLVTDSTFEHFHTWSARDPAAVEALMKASTMDSDSSNSNNDYIGNDMINGPSIKALLSDESHPMLREIGNSVCSEIIADMCSVASIPLQNQPALHAHSTHKLYPNNNNLYNKLGSELDEACKSVSNAMGVQVDHEKLVERDINVVAERLMISRNENTLNKLNDKISETGFDMMKYYCELNQISEANKMNPLNNANRKRHTASTASASASTSTATATTATAQKISSANTQQTSVANAQAPRQTPSAAAAAAATSNEVKPSSVKERQPVINPWLRAVPPLVPQAELKRLILRHTWDSLAVSERVRIVQRVIPAISNKFQAAVSAAPSFKCAICNCDNPSGIPDELQRAVDTVFNNMIRYAKREVDTLGNRLLLVGNNNNTGKSVVLIKPSERVAATQVNHHPVLPFDDVHDMGGRDLAGTILATAANSILDSATKRYSQQQQNATGGKKKGGKHHQSHQHAASNEPTSLLSPEQHSLLMSARPDKPVPVIQAVAEIPLDGKLNALQKISSNTQKWSAITELIYRAGAKRVSATKIMNNPFTLLCICKKCFEHEPPAQQANRIDHDCPMAVAENSMFHEIYKATSPRRDSTQSDANANSNSTSSSNSNSNATAGTAAAAATTGQRRSFSSMPVKGQSASGIGTQPPNPLLAAELFQGDEWYMNRSAVNACSWSPYYINSEYAYDIDGDKGPHPRYLCICGFYHEPTMNNPPTPLPQPNPVRNAIPKDVPNKNPYMSAMEITKFRPLNVAASEAGVLPASMELNSIEKTARIYQFQQFTARLFETDLSVEITEVLRKQLEAETLKELLGENSISGSGSSNINSTSSTSHGNIASGNDSSLINDDLLNENSAGGFKSKKQREKEKKRQLQLKRENDLKLKAEAEKAEQARKLEAQTQQRLAAERRVRQREEDERKRKEAEVQLMQQQMEKLRRQREQDEINAQIKAAEERERQTKEANKRKQERVEREKREKEEARIKAELQAKQTAEREAKQAAERKRIAEEAAAKVAAKMAAEKAAKKAVEEAKAKAEAEAKALAEAEARAKAEAEAEAEAEAVELARELAAQLELQQQETAEQSSLSPMQRQMSSILGSPSSLLMSRPISNIQGRGSTSPHVTLAQPMPLSSASVSMTGGGGGPPGLYAPQPTSSLAASVLQNLTGPSPLSAMAGSIIAATTTTTTGSAGSGVTSVTGGFPHSSMQDLYSQQLHYPQHSQQFQPSILAGASTGLLSSVPDPLNSLSRKPTIGSVLGGPNAGLVDIIGLGSRTSSGSSRLPSMAQLGTVNPVLSRMHTNDAQQQQQQQQQQQIQAPPVSSTPNPLAPIRSRIFEVYSEFESHRLAGSKPADSESTSDAKPFGSRSYPWPLLYGTYLYRFPDRSVTEAILRRAASANVKHTVPNNAVIADDPTIEPVDDGLEFVLSVHESNGETELRVIVHSQPSPAPQEQQQQQQQHVQPQPQAQLSRQSTLTSMTSPLAATPIREDFDLARLHAFNQPSAPAASVNPAALTSGFGIGSSVLGQHQPLGGHRTIGDGFSSFMSTSRPLGSAGGLAGGFAPSGLGGLGGVGGLAGMSSTGGPRLSLFDNPAPAMPSSSLFAQQHIPHQQHHQQIPSLSGPGLAFPEIGKNLNSMMSLSGMNPLGTSQQPSTVGTGHMIGSGFDLLGGGGGGGGSTAGLGAGVGVGVGGIGAGLPRNPVNAMNRNMISSLLDPMLNPQGSLGSFLPTTTAAASAAPATSAPGTGGIPARY